MSTQQLEQPPVAVRRLSFLGLLLVTALTVYSASRPLAPTRTNATFIPQSEPAASSVLNYIRVHESIPAHAAPLDPAVQSVMDYIRVHNSIPDRVSTMDPAVKSVLDYLRAHGSY